MAELKQCPFCGRIPTVEDCGTNRWFVRCQCGIAQDKLYHQRCDAVRAWNRRKPVTDVPSAVVGTQMSSADCISRQAAIDALDTLCDRECEYSKKQRSFMCGACRLGSVFDVIDELPSAQPTLYGYKIEHLAYIARVMEKEGVTAEYAVRTFDDLSRAIRMILDEAQQKSEEMLNERFN